MATLNTSQHDYVQTLREGTDLPGRDLSRVFGEYSPSAAPDECRHHWAVKVSAGRPCHACSCLRMFDASITARVRAGDVGVALAQMRFLGR